MVYYAMICFLDLKRNASLYRRVSNIPKQNEGKNKTFKNRVKIMLYVMLWYAWVWYDEWESMRLYAVVWYFNAMVWNSNAMLGYVFKYYVCYAYGVCYKKTICLN